MKLQCMTYESPIWRWMRIFSPCIISLLLSLAFVICCFLAGTLQSLVAAAIATMIAGVFYLSDVIVKQVAKRNVKAMCISELIIVAAIILMVVGLV